MDAAVASAGDTACPPIALDASYVPDEFTAPVTKGKRTAHTRTFAAAPDMAYVILDKALKKKQADETKQLAATQQEMEHRRRVLDREAELILVKKRAQERQVQEYLKAQIAEKKEQQEQQKAESGSPQALPTAWMAAAEDSPTNSAAFRRARAAAYRLQLDMQVQQKAQIKQAEKLKDRAWAEKACREAEADLVLSYR